jgi:hypothetical protein
MKLGSSLYHPGMVYTAKSRTQSKAMRLNSYNQEKGNKSNKVQPIQEKLGKELGLSFNSIQKTSPKLLKTAMIIVSKSLHLRLNISRSSFLCSRDHSRIQHVALKITSK